MIDRYTVQRILDTAQIVDVVSDFVSLKRAGANFKGLCPFHDDRTPSFMVSPAKNYCKCFACGKGGSPVGFIMEHEQLSYPDALRYLAKKYNIEVEEREQTPEEKQEATERESMFVLNEFALSWFEKQLYETSEGTDIGMAYFRHRGFRDDIIRKFRLGYSPSTRDALCREAISKGYNKEYLLKTGLAYESQGGGRMTDRFNGRVIFPIFTASGKVCGFGGRVLAAATKGVNVKYQNSPESVVYSKKRELYGLYQAKNAIAKHNCCFLVEGYTDVMAMHQMGVENVVASSGTALTTQQIALIHRLTSNIVVIYDGDAAGIKASQRGIDMLLEAGMNVRLLLLPDGDDPDSFARKHTSQEYQNYINTHQVDFIGFKTDLLMQESQNDPIKMSALVSNIVESISKIPDSITRTAYIRQAAQHLSMSEQLIASTVGKALKLQQDSAIRLQHVQEGHAADDETLPTQNGDNNASDSQPQLQIELPQSAIHIFERELVKIIVTFGDHDLCTISTDDGEKTITVTEYIQMSLQQDKLQFETPIYQRILNASVENVTGARMESEKFFMNHQDIEMSKLAFELATGTEQLSKYHTKQSHIPSDAERLMEIVPTLLSHYKLGVVEAQLKQTVMELRIPNAINDKSVANKVMQRYVNLKKVQSILAKECGDRVICAPKI